MGRFVSSLCSYIVEAAVMCFLCCSKGTSRNTRLDQWLCMVDKMMWLAQGQR
jgi:hypothetical protein